MRWLPKWVIFALVPAQPPANQRWRPFGAGVDEGADLRCAHVRKVKRVASMHTCVAMTTVFLPPSAIRSWERATSAHRYSVPYLSLPHPAARSVSPAASHDPAPTARAPAQPSRALAPTPVGCGPVPPPPRTRVISPPHPALLFAALTVPLSEQAPPPRRRLPADCPARGLRARDQGLKASDWESVIRSSPLIDRCPPLTLFWSSSPQLALVEVSVISDWFSSVAPSPDWLS